MPPKSYMPRHPVDMSLWPCPEIRPGTKVQWAPTPDWKNPAPATVLQQTGNTWTLEIFTPRGRQVREGCHHRSDPRCESQRDRFHNNECGVFEVTSDEQETQGLSSRLDACEMELMSLKAQVATLRQSILSPATPSPATPSPPVRPSAPPPEPIWASRPQPESVTA